MNDKSAVEIQLSKSKLTLMFLGSIIFVGLGIWFLIDPTRFISPFHRSTSFIFIAGLASILFFGFVGFYLFKKLFDKNFGLVISDDGIIDNSSGLSAGFIPWTDIEAIKETRVANQQFINLVVKNPQVYIDRQTSSVKRWAMRKNYKSFDTAIGISANGLKYNYEDLKALLHKKFQEYKSKTIIKQH
ncbi:MAG: hypothetical protein H7Y86_18095 [Rhizobacter sp.]|nr:hypothetical protein [Ferruginibacter sp.]